MKPDHLNLILNIFTLLGVLAGYLKVASSVNQSIARSQREKRLLIFVVYNILLLRARRPGPFTSKAMIELMENAFGPDIKM